MKKAIYQTGVDVLGFPTYTEHCFFEGKTKPAAFIKNKTAIWKKVVSINTKQH